MAGVKISACFLIFCFFFFSFFPPCLKSRLRIFFKQIKKKKSFSPVAAGARKFTEALVRPRSSPSRRTGERSCRGEDKSPSAHSRIKKSNLVWLRFAGAGAGGEDGGGGRGGSGCSRRGRERFGRRWSWFSGSRLSAERFASLFFPPSRVREALQSSCSGDGFGH